ncbi:MAG: cysteine synthase A [Deltaproteobacteria bacterium]|nr:cysteine synthase A [Deltaproteobacteria bacterium]
MAIVESLLELVGGTSVLRLRRVCAAPGAEVWVKLEQQNPGGSVKDRIAVAMLDDAARRGHLHRGGTVVEPTSGNTGIGLALACALKGYRLVLTMPESMSLERRALLKAYGAEVVLTPEEAQLDGAIARARELVEATPGAFLPGQFDNPANPACHQGTTAREVLDAFPRLDAFVAGVGTGGTITGVGRALREARPGVQVVAVEPEGCATISRGERGPTKIQGLAAGFVPRNYDPSVVDRVLTVTDGDAWRMKIRLARQEGLLVGISSGCAVHAACEVARSLPPEAVVLTVLADTGERYFSLDTYFAEATP